MKFRLLVFVLLFSSGLFGQHKIQTYASFAIDQKEVVWVQVYPQNDAQENLSGQVLDFLKRKSWIKNLQFDGQEIMADLENFRVDYKRYGGKYMNTSMLIRSARWSGKIRVSFKDGKYRVIIYGLNYDARQPSMSTGKMTQLAHPIHGTWTDWVLNNYRSAFLTRRHKNLDLMHFSLKDSFTLSEIAFDNADW
ncbi:MAG: hypothetical protein ABIR06_16070 [Cyclobacteriaceae bacterium]